VNDTQTFVSADIHFVGSLSAFHNLIDDDDNCSALGVSQLFIAVAISNTAVVVSLKVSHLIFLNVNNIF
jgi:hypothetical protein